MPWCSTSGAPRTRPEQGIISPSWSIHSGVGTASCSFVWAMVGESQTFTDVDAVAMDALGQGSEPAAG